MQSSKTVHGRQKMKNKLTTAEKYQQLKKQTEAAGMTVKEKNKKLIVSRKKGKKK